MGKKKKIGNSNKFIEVKSNVELLDKMYKNVLDFTPPILYLHTISGNLLKVDLI